jgi:hypothetical protein
VARINNQNKKDGRGYPKARISISKQAILRRDTLGICIERLVYGTNIFSTKIRRMYYHPHEQEKVKASIDGRK